MVALPHRADGCLVMSEELISSPPRFCLCDTTASLKDYTLRGITSCTVGTDHEPPCCFSAETSTGSGGLHLVGFVFDKRSNLLHHVILLLFHQFRKDRKREDLDTGAFAMGKVSPAIAKISEALLEV